MKNTRKVRITLEDKSYMDVEVYEDIAPLTTKNFLKLVNEKFYDGIIFHRIIKDFMVQTGGYYLMDNKIINKEVEPIKGEFTTNGFVNPLRHTKGVISMARTNDPNSASSQFFVCTKDAPHLDGSYAAFGKVIGDISFETLEKLNNARTEYLNRAMSDFPYPIIRIASIEEIQ